MPTVTKVPIGAEDINFDTGGAGTTTTFTRTEPTGPDGTYDKVNASQLPVLDAAVVTSARTPFAAILAADRDVEECLKKIRINAREMKNIEHYGATAGSGVSAAVAERNTLAWKQCLDDINSEGRNNGIFFPGARYEFLELTVPPGAYATNILPMQTTGGTHVGNLVIAGSPTTTIAAHSSAGVAKRFLYASGGASNIYFVDVRIEALPTTTASAVYLDPGAAAGVMANIHFDRVVMTNGKNNIEVAYTSGANYVKNLWVTNSTFGGIAASMSGHIAVEDVSGMRIVGNVFVDTNAGLVVSGVGTVAFGDYTIEDNTLVESNAAITVLVAGTFTSAIHNNVTIKKNRVAQEIQVFNVNALRVEENIVNAGLIYVSHGAISSAYSIRISRNMVSGNLVAGTSSGILYSTGSANTRRLWIDDNDIYRARGDGIRISATGATSRIYGAKVHDNMILDCGQAATNTYDGIFLANDNADAGIVDSIIKNNQATSTSALLKHRYGVHEEAGGASNYNYFRSNIVKGWGTAAILMTGANSRDTVGPNSAPLAGSNTTIDLGTGV